MLATRLSKLPHTRRRLVGRIARQGVADSVVASALESQLDATGADIVLTEPTGTWRAPAIARCVRPVVTPHFARHHRDAWIQTLTWRQPCSRVHAPAGLRARRAQRRPRVEVGARGDDRSPAHRITDRSTRAGGSPPSRPGVVRWGEPRPALRSRGGSPPSWRLRHRRGARCAAASPNPRRRRE